MSIDARIQRVAKGLSAKQAADAFVRARDEDPMSLSPRDLDKAAEFEATVEAMFLMAAVDGDLSDNELAQLAASIDAFAELGENAKKKKVDAGPLLIKMNKLLEKD